MRSYLVNAVTPEQKQQLLAHAAEFWFVVSSDSLEKVRTTILKWQDRNQLTMPFLFLSVAHDDTAQASVLLQPFFTTITDVGSALPRNNEVAWAMGVFWCEKHQTQTKLDKYLHAADQFVPSAHRLDLRPTDVASAVKEELSKLWHDADRVAWLWGAWSDTALIRADATLPLSAWVDNSSCQSRIAFVSALPVSKPRKEKFFEPAAFDWLPACIGKMRQTAGDPAAFSSTVQELQQHAKKSPVFVGISSCGKFALFCE